MTLPRIQTLYRCIVVAPLLASGCDAAASAGIAPDIAARKMADRSEKIVGGGGLSLSIYEAGRTGAPPIVFIHGFTQNSLTWDAQFRSLAAQFHVIAYDFRGHGASDKPLDAEKYKDSALWADDLAAVIRAEVRASMNATRTLTRMFAPQESGMWEIAFGSAMMMPPEARLARFSRVLENDDVLSRIRVPTLVVHGTADRLVKLSAAQHGARTIPSAKLLAYDGVGHAPHLETPARFNRDLAEFVRSVR